MLFSGKRCARQTSNTFARANKAWRLRVNDQTGQKLRGRFIEPIRTVMYANGKVGDLNAPRPRHFRDLTPGP